MRIFAQRHPFLTKAGSYAGGGIAGLGAYIGISQVDRAIQKAQDRAEDKTEEKHKNLTDTLEADLLRENLANEKFKQQSEFASKVLADAILAGQVPTALIENITQRQPVIPVQDYGFLPEISRDVNLSRQIEPPQELTRSEESLVVDMMRQEQQEMEKLLKRKKKLILREEEEELQHPRTELSALDRLSQWNGYQLSLPEPVRVPRFATKDWGKPGTVDEDKKIVLAWCVGSLLLVSLLGFIIVTWRCCRKKKENEPSPSRCVRGFLALHCGRKKKETSISAEQDAHDSVELEPLK